MSLVLLTCPVPLASNTEHAQQAGRCESWQTGSTTPAVRCVMKWFALVSVCCVLCSLCTQAKRSARAARTGFDVERVAGQIRAFIASEGDMLTLDVAGKHAQVGMCCVCVCVCVCVPHVYCRACTKLGHVLTKHLIRMCVCVCPPNKPQETAIRLVRVAGLKGSVCILCVHVCVCVCVSHPCRRPLYASYV